MELRGNITDLKAGVAAMIMGVCERGEGTAFLLGSKSDRVVEDWVSRRRAVTRALLVRWTTTTSNEVCVAIWGSDQQLQREQCPEAEGSIGEA